MKKPFYFLLPYQTVEHLGILIFHAVDNMEMIASIEGEVIGYTVTEHDQIIAYLKANGLYVMLEREGYV
jgi:hypothetical protein